MKRLVGALIVVVVLAECAGLRGETPVSGDLPPATTSGAAAPAAVVPTLVPDEGDPAPEPPPEGGADLAPLAAATPTGSTAAQTPTAAASPYLTVTVGSGDTLLGLAMAHEVPMAAIQLQNEMGSSTVVQLGTELVIPPRSAWEGASPFWIVHEVSEGETLSEIAKIYGLGVADLQGANGLADADLLGIGQTLVLPLTDFAEARAVASDAPALTATPVAEVATAAPTVAQAAAVVAPPPADVAAWGRETVRIINEVRAAHGLPPLIYNDTLAQAGQIQANDCAQRGSCSHTGSDGSTIKERILRVGYEPASWAECWAIRQTPQAAVDIWMDEVPPNDPHRRTLLTTWLTEIGVGVAEAHWGYYFIADFGRPLQ